MGMAVFLEQVELPDRCFLREILCWVAFQRLPTAIYTMDGDEWRENSETCCEYHVDIGDHISEAEGFRAGIPQDPRYDAYRKDSPTISTVATYDKLLEIIDLDRAERAKFKLERKIAQKFEAECASWDAQYLRAIEYPASKIFVALRGGELRTAGRLLPSLLAEEADSILAAEDRSLLDISPTDIPANFWSLGGIDFHSSAARNDTAHYCHVTARLADVLEFFPGERTPVSGLERIGSSYVLNEADVVTVAKSQRGRPSYPWDKFNLEVTALVRANALPPKKEAAIQHFQSWFEREFKAQVSRAAIGEKLKPYYDRFMRGLDR